MSKEKGPIHNDFKDMNMVKVQILKDIKMVSMVINLVLIFREELASQVMEMGMAIITDLFKDNK